MKEIRVSGQCNCRVERERERVIKMFERMFNVYVPNRNFYKDAKKCINTFIDNFVC